MIVLLDNGHGALINGKYQTLGKRKDWKDKGVIYEGEFNRAIVNGIFQIVGLVFLGIKEVTDFAENRSYYAALSIEFIENVVEDILDIDFLGLFKEFLFFPIKLVSTVVKFTGKAAEVTLEQAFYFVGYVVGFIVETVIGILFTGGTLNISKVLVKTFKEPVELLLKGIKKTAETATSLISKIIHAVKSIFKALKKPDQLVNDFIKFIEDLLGVTKKAVKTISIYSKRYVGGKLQPLIKSSKASALYGRAGKQVVKAVDKTVEQILILGLSNNKLSKDFVMVSGMVFKKGVKISNPITKTNFSRAEIGMLSKKTGKFINRETGDLSDYQKFLDNLHPVLKDRYNRHLDEITKGLNASANDIARAGKPGSHGEIRALDELLKIIDPNGKKYGDDVFKYIYGYNRFLSKTGIQPPCAHCHFLTDLVTYIGL